MEWVILGILLLILLLVIYRNNELCIDTFDNPPVIRSCPDNLTNVITKTGSQDCQDTTGTSICTLSAAYGTIKTCSDYVNSKFKLNGNKLCPSSMPKYFENDTSKGCTSVDGSKKCTIYSNDTDNNINSNSCLMEKTMENFSCPYPGGKTTVTNGYITCSVINNKGMQQCNDDATYIKYLNTTLPSWKTTFSAQQKGTFCSIVAASKKTGKPVSSFPWPNPPV
jgi:hypothetical protein